VAREISVVVPARCRATDLAGLLGCLEAQTLDRDRFEILIVDDASDPPLRGALRLDQPSGSYAARNAGIAAARAPLLAFTDADCLPEPRWLEAGLIALGTAPRAAGRIEMIGGETYFERLDRARFLRQDRYVDEGFGATANLFVRREVFDAIGTFDARLRSGGDAELGRRASAARFPIVFAPDAVVRHPCRRSARELLGKAHRVGVGFGQTARLHGIDARSPSRAGDRLRLFSSKEPLIAAGLLALHGATLLGALLGYMRAEDDIGRHPGAG
jgi:glycosyltransferase involved in cell wall biosynthesis